LRMRVRIRVGVGGWGWDAGGKKLGPTLVNRPSALPKPAWLRSFGMSASETTGSGTCIEVSE
jgi:hypothetical protein